MSVGAIGSNAGPWQWQSQPPPSPPRMTNTAQLLGISTNQLAQDLQSGTTLSSLASKQGVSSSSLISSIEKDLQEMRRRARPLRSAACWTGSRPTSPTAPGRSAVNITTAANGRRG